MSAAMAKIIEEDKWKRDRPVIRPSSISEDIAKLSIFRRRIISFDEFM